MRVYFYPATYLRDRMLDTVRQWPVERVYNPEILERRKGAQVSAEHSLAPRQALSWRQRLPLVNVKRRPNGLPPDVVLYLWGAIPATGPFILDLDNPLALTGYNVQAFELYRPLLAGILASRRCVAIRCMSRACRNSIEAMLGARVADKAEVCYPVVPQAVTHLAPDRTSDQCRFVFIGTQFEIKGGGPLLKAFRRLVDLGLEADLDVVTHLPAEFEGLARSCPGLTIHPARFTREEIASEFLSKADALVHPTFVESFGMTVLEALSHGLAVISSDVYALPEMVQDGVNGVLLRSPYSMWDGWIPSRHYRDWWNAKAHIRALDLNEYEEALFVAMRDMVSDRSRRIRMKQASIDLFAHKFRTNAARPVSSPAKKGLAITGKNSV